MNIIFWGTPKFCVPIFESIIESRHIIKAVITQPDKRRGRGGRLTYSPIKELSLKYNIPVLTPENIKDDKSIQKEIEMFNADLYIIVAFGQILPKNILIKPKYGCWNIHASLLPKWRGPAPIQWSLINGDKETGVAIMAMEQGLDTGPILLESKIIIDPLDNFYSLSEKLSILSSKLIIEALEIIELSNPINKNNCNLKLKCQEELERDFTYARLIRKGDLLINWELSSMDIHKKILGLYPNAYSFLNNKRVKIIDSIPYNEYYLRQIGIEDKFDNINNKKSFRLGQIISHVKNEGVLVNTKDIPILIKKIKIEGKKESSGENLIKQLKSLGNIFSSVN